MERKRRVVFLYLKKNSRRESSHRTRNKEKDRNAVLQNQLSEDIGGSGA